MATCTVIRAEPVPPPVAKVVLELSLDEATYLRFLLGYCVIGGVTRGGYPNDDIWKALKGSGEIPDQCRQFRVTDEGGGVTLRIDSAK